MGTAKITVNELDSLSSAELAGLADEYGIELPGDLDRSFIISELLDIIAEQDEDKIDIDIKTEQNIQNDTNELRQSYNETQISLVLRNPVWAYVFWDISVHDMEKLESAKDGYTLLLRVDLYYKEAAKYFGLPSNRVNIENSNKKINPLVSALKPYSTYEIQIDNDSRERFILLPAGESYFTASLVADFSKVNINDEFAPTPHENTAKKREQLCQSEVFHIEEACSTLMSQVFGFDMKFSEILTLSGMNELLHNHYVNHRNSFVKQNIIKEGEK